MKSQDYLNTLREMSDAELAEKRKQTEQDLFQLRYKAVTEQSDNTSTIQQKRKDLARVLTIINGRRRGAERQKGA